MNRKDVTGTWKVTITATGGNQVWRGYKRAFFLTASQIGTTVSGTLETVYGLTGQVKGEISGDEVSMTIDQGPVRPGTFHAVAKIGGSVDDMNGTYCGADTHGTLEASFSALRTRWWHRVMNTILFNLKNPIIALVLTGSATFMFAVKAHYVLECVAGAVVLAWLAWAFRYHLQFDPALDDEHKKDLMTQDTREVNIIFLAFNLLALILVISASYIFIVVP